MHSRARQSPGWIRSVGPPLLRGAITFTGTLALLGALVASPLRALGFGATRLSEAAQLLRGVPAHDLERTLARYERTRYAALVEAVAGTGEDVDVLERVFLHARRGVLPEPWTLQYVRARAAGPAIGLDD